MKGILREGGEIRKALLGEGTTVVGIGAVPICIGLHNESIFTIGQPVNGMDILSRPLDHHTQFRRRQRKVYWCAYLLTP